MLGRQDAEAYPRDLAIEEIPWTDGQILKLQLSTV